MSEKQATDPCELERMIMDSNIAKSEAEWWAKARIEELEQQLADATKQNVMLRDALEITHELYANATSGYGFARPDNPHNFYCDIECCSKEEIAAHSKACDDYAAGRKVSDDSWGIGTYCDEYEPALKALAATTDLDGLILCHAEEVAWYIPEKDLSTTDSEWAAENSEMCEPLYRAKEQGK